MQVLKTMGAEERRGVQLADLEEASQRSQCSTLVIKRNELPRQ